MSINPFSPSTILRLISESLPSDEQPQLKNPQDAIAIFIHACMLTVGFRLVGLSEDDRISSPSDESAPQPLPSNWNSSSGSSYGFRYSHSQSSMVFLVKINRLGGKTVIMGLGLGDDKTTSFDIVTKDFTSESFFPYSSIGSEGDQLEILQDGFISTNRMSDLAILVKINIVQKLVPGIIKPGYEEEAEETKGGGGGGGQASRQQQQPRPHHDDGNNPLPVPPPYGSPYGGLPRGGPPPIPAGGEHIPGFDDEYGIYQPPRGRGGYGYPPGGRNPLSIGADDLNPPGLGPNPPMVGPFFGEGSGSSGMHPTGDHPIFGGNGGGRMGMRGGYGRGPPGSRYDPIGPGDEQPMGGLRGPRGPGGPGGGPGFGGSGPHNPFSSYGSGDFM
ncbi:PI31 proteasome regulator N-terminal-domain-containing protein [Tricharina praecox]|uniref:PI31 proteasome regulator N-terminal-domain-containing protein n=1 Tax=Tricharina praecox TaxID=43433 RepID=UPI00222028DB|nr:PI31 proteasome regulator N-terminal-domain-containing protein [Tricharina praecox]KAI5846042.1 PI31 proteasome regulator N-terminal-domain-containing protein [Tricharina praecox]